MIILRSQFCATANRMMQTAQCSIALTAIQNGSHGVRYRSTTGIRINSFHLDKNRHHLYLFSQNHMRGPHYAKRSGSPPPLTKHLVANAAHHHGSCSFLVSKLRPVKDKFKAQFSLWFRAGFRLSRPAFSFVIKTLGRGNGLRKIEDWSNMSMKFNI
jgi:hypothetical protein